MAGEDLKNRVNWLDEERRKDKALLTKLEEKLSGLAAAAESQAKQLQDITTQLTKLNTRLQADKLDALLARQREETTRALEAMEKRRLDFETQAGRNRALEKDRVDKIVADFKKQIDAIGELTEFVAARKADQARQANFLLTLEAIQKRDEERTRIAAAAEEGRRQDVRRVADIQGEQQAMRQKSDEQDARLETVEAAAHRLEGRLSELMGLELERRNAMAMWQEQQTSEIAERERQWKDWEKRSAESIARIEAFLAKLDSYKELNRSMSQAIEEYKSLAERQDQRLKETSEIQRIQEDRLRQDWTSFLADDQKRWMAQNLNWEEEGRDRDRKITRAVERINRMEEQSQTLMDSLRTAQEGDQARLEALANMIREWLARSSPK